VSGSAPQFPDPLGVREVVRPGATAHKAGLDLVRRVAALEQGALGRPGPGVPNGSGIISDTTQTGGARWENRSIVSSLPGSPVDGQECYYQSSAMASNGVVWHFKYQSGMAGSYKWVFVGGAPVLSQTDNTTRTTTSTGYTTITGTPGVNCPLAGDYIVVLGARIWNNTNGGNSFMSFVIGATPAIDDNATSIQALIVSPHVNVATTFRQLRLNGINANTDLNERVRVNVGTGSFANRSISLLPIRVG